MSLIKQALSGVKWTTLSAMVTVGIQLLQTLILARLLRPEDFGLMAIVTVVIGFAQTYSDLGISSAIIQRQDSTPDQLSSLYWLNVTAGVLLFMLVWIFSPLIAFCFHQPNLKSLVGVVALTFLIAPAGVQFQMLLQKNLHFRLLAIQEITAALFGLAVACSCAFSGYGVWSFVYAQLTTVIARTVFYLRSGWKKWPPDLHFRLADLKGYISFGLYQMGERTITYWNSRLDQLLIGYFLGPAALGYYSFAFNLVMQPISRINPVLTSIAFPLFSKVQNDGVRLGSGYFLLQKILSAVNFPALTGLVVVAPTLIPLMFGNHWRPAIPLIQVLAFVAILRATANPIGSLLLARGRADLGFKWNAALLCTQLPGVYIGVIYGGVPGVCIALLIMQVVYFWLGYPVLVRRLLGACFSQYVMSMTPALILSLVMAVPLFLVPVMFGGIAPAWVVCIQVICGVVIYGVLNWIFRKEWLSEVRNMVSSS